jgi:hypothetical protein
MSEPERYLLLALSLLIARQRARVRGEEEPYFFRARGAFRCALEKMRRELFSSSALGPHVKLVQVQPGAVEAKLSEEFTRRLGLAAEDTPFAVYSPLQVFFTAGTGFFVPQREPWHAYAGRCVAARISGARCAPQAELTRVTWPEGSFEAGERSGAARLAYASPALRFELQLGQRGFEFRAAGALQDLRKFCVSGAMPEGVRASVEGSGELRIRGAV